MVEANKQGRDGKDIVRRYWPRLFLIVPFALVLYVPFYNRIEPTLVGIPFFYWYQLAAILLGAMVVMGVYIVEERIAPSVDEPPEADQPEANQPEGNEPKDNKKDEHQAPPKGPGAGA